METVSRKRSVSSEKTNRVKREKTAETIATAEGQAKEAEEIGLSVRETALKAKDAEQKAKEIDLRAQQAALKVKEAELDAIRITLRITSTTLGARESALGTKAAALDAREIAMDAKESEMSMEFSKQETNMMARFSQEAKAKDEAFAQMKKDCEAAQRQICLKNVEIAKLSQEAGHVRKMLMAAYEKLFGELHGKQLAISQMKKEAECIEELLGADEELRQEARHVVLANMSKFVRKLSHTCSNCRLKTSSMGCGDARSQLCCPKGIPVTRKEVFE